MESTQGVPMTNQGPAPSPPIIGAIGQNGEAGPARANGSSQASSPSGRPCGPPPTAGGWGRARPRAPAHRRPATGAPLCRRHCASGTAMPVRRRHAATGTPAPMPLHGDFGLLGLECASGELAAVEPLDASHGCFAKRSQSVALSFLPVHPSLRRDLRRMVLPFRSAMRRVRGRNGCGAWRDDDFRW